MKKTTIILGVIIVVIAAGIFIFQSPDTVTSGNLNTTPTGTPSPSSFPDVEEDFAGKILSINPEKIVMQDYGGNTIDVILNDQVTYYDKGMPGGRGRKEISFSSFTVGEWIAVRVRRTPSSRQKRAIIKIVCYTDEPK